MELPPYELVVHFYCGTLYITALFSEINYFVLNGVVYVFVLRKCWFNHLF